nr:hypothetical protein [Klebsiella pneumoniae subsp. pneumoniae]
MSFFAAQENLTGIDMNIAQQRPGERRTFAIIAHHQVKARSSTGPLVFVGSEP